MDSGRSHKEGLSKIQTVNGNDDVIHHKRNMSSEANTHSKKVKGRVHTRTGQEGPEGEQIYSCALSLTSALDEVGQRHAPTVLPPGKRAGTHFTGSWLGPSVRLDG